MKIDRYCRTLPLRAGAALLSLTGAILTSFPAKAQPAPEYGFLCEPIQQWQSTLKVITSVDRISFFGPLDEVYGNSCDASRGGGVQILVDTNTLSVEVRVLPQATACPRNYVPVNAMQVHFGPLPPGNWTFWSAAYKFTNQFTVFPEPPRPVISSAVSSNQLVLEWKGVRYQNYEVEASPNLQTWSSVQAPVEWTGENAKASFGLTDSIYYRIKRTSLTQDVVRVSWTNWPGRLSQGSCGR
jgi:hypothetical protein